MTDSTNSMDNTTDVETTAPAETTTTPAMEGTAPETAMEAVTQHPSKVQEAYSQTMNTLYLSGFSFILGVLFTVLILLILDFMRRNRTDQEK